MCQCGNCTTPTCQCSDGTDGLNIWSVTTANFIQPAVSGNVTVPVSSQLQYSVLGFGVGQILYIENGGYYSLVSVNSNTSITVTNLGYTGNASPGATINSGSKVSPGGRVGPAGASGVSGTSILVNNISASNSSGSGNQNLKTYTLPINLTTDGDAITVIGIVYNGTPSGSSKTAGMYLTGTLNTANTLITNYGSTSPVDNMYIIESTISRRTSTSVLCVTKMMVCTSDPILYAATSPAIVAGQGQFLPAVVKVVPVSDLNANTLEINLFVNPSSGADIMTANQLLTLSLQI